MSFVIGFVLFAMVVVPLFLQQVQGYGPDDTGLILASQGLGAAIVMPAAGLLTDRRPRLRTWCSASPAASASP
ncbi:MAG TPA: hypothetical protein VKF14_19790 [Candidatus Dormibacteraeota bacterium]|nr:hypothetical protein [Candidatus Dormibacteraeota bacterium]